uniref:Uncharacterized protein n=1 Tax=Aegilops tauschii subsp. strangulata TaxID=200361 RepID=A0A452ZD94_AEGTS
MITWYTVVMNYLIFFFFLAPPGRSFLFSAGILYEVDKLSGMILARSESKARRY